MARGKAHSDEVKAAVIAALLSGAGVNDTARKFNLPPMTVSRFKSEIAQELVQVGTEKRGRIDDLLLDAISEHVIAIKKIAQIGSEPEYAKKQPAESLAVLYREIASVSIRLLEAASAAGVGESGIDETEGETS